MINNGKDLTEEMISGKRNLNQEREVIHLLRRRKNLNQFQKLQREMAQVM
jgi:hypothetical protein